ncbi:murein hydrolase activator EnvC family protein [Vannielia litorea]|uniref:Septal ring factor EnvC, activator of murein hydrolases AmiA and AmiB n=1 Tax=Vannielia litorea TaxID=1217970 RepID=A0A1N6II20_9RHOB|nr:peptidoglycan DD-metalloendopeptidase family protein [Vannielia litorea]SIO31672.1 Septal ring factor EnvC, activator of murein hydrolases AmiA and AmiB [Vannielia litorea]
MIRAALLALALAAPATAQQTDPASIAVEAASLLTKAAAALQEAETRADRVEALTRTVRAYETGLSALRTGLRQAAIREGALRATLEAREAEVSRLLGVLSTMERSPAPLLLLHPSGPAGTARAAMILGAVTPGLQAEAAALRAQVEEIALLQVLQESAGETLEEGLRGAQEARLALTQAIDERTDLPRRYVEDPTRLRQLLETSDTLAAFAGGLAEIDGDTAPEDAAFEAQKGTLALPGPATVIRRYEEPDAAGIARPGLLLALYPGTLLTAPAAATIRYTGPLLDYGNVMILEPAPDTLLVLAGMETVYGEAGQIVAAGAPLGLMGGQTLGTAAGEFARDPAREAGAERSETLYMELRQGEAPVDPTDWFAATKDG